MEPGRGSNFEKDSDDLAAFFGNRWVKGVLFVLAMIIVGPLLIGVLL